MHIQSEELMCDNNNSHLTTIIIPVEGRS